MCRRRRREAHSQEALLYNRESERTDFGSDIMSYADRGLEVVLARTALISFSIRVGRVLESVGVLNVSHRESVVSRISPDSA